jgi:hypothetical protein
MADSKFRDLQRRATSGDPEAAAAALRERVRCGELTNDHVELAAYLGHKGARALCPEKEEVEWISIKDQRQAVMEAARRVGKTLPARVAADWAGRWLPKWEAVYPDDPRPRAAISAARAWADCPCEDHRAQCARAMDAAQAAANQAGIDEMNAAGAEEEAISLAGDAAIVATNAARAGCATTRGTQATAARDALFFPEDDQEEGEWQRLRLAAYVLGEI